MGTHKSEKESPAARDGAAGAGVEQKMRWGSLQATYPNLGSRAIHSYCIGPDLIVQSIAFSAAVLNG